MPNRVEQQSLNASSLDIINVIRENASYEYQSLVPRIEQASDIPKVGEIITGTPALANQFLNSLVNRIARTFVQSATFNNPYAPLKKGMVEYGETIEDIFVQIAKVVDYSAEKGASREFRRTIPDVRSVFHIMNWRTMYPVTIQDQDLKRAFLSIDGVTNLISEILRSVYQAAEYDEFLLFKYLIIKGIAHGEMYTMPVGAPGTDIHESAIAYRGMSNTLPFMSDKYNSAHVLTTTPKNRQAIFMDAMYNAQFDVEVLARAFNMEKADFMGRLHLIDNWNTFDNKRFNEIREASDGLEAVTDEELAVMDNVVAILVDTNWFQVYDNLAEFRETYVGAGMYRNYFYHTWKTISYSPFANAVCFQQVDAVPSPLTPRTLTITGVDQNEVGMTVDFSVTEPVIGVGYNGALHFIQTKEATENLIGVQKYGGLVLGKDQFDTPITLEAQDSEGHVFVAETQITPSSVKVGDSVTLTYDSSIAPYSINTTATEKATSTKTRRNKKNTTE